LGVRQRSPNPAVLLWLVVLLFDHIDHDAKDQNRAEGLTGHRRQRLATAEWPRRSSQAG